MAAPRPVAEVVIDIDLPNLDHPFEYAIPPDLAEQVQVGRVVTVPYRGRKMRGWVVGVRPQPSFHGRLLPIASVVSQLPVFTAGLLASARYLADRYAATLSQVFSLAIPKTVKAVDAQVIAEEGAEQGRREDVPSGVAGSNGGNRNADDGSVARRAPSHQVISVLPQGRAPLLRDLLQKTVTAGKGILIVVPTARDVRAVSSELAGHVDPNLLAILDSTTKPREKYLIHQRCRTGRLQVVVGTRSAVWLPMANLDTIVVWDDGDDRLRERRSPQVDAMDVAVARSFKEQCAVVFASYSRSLKAQQLVDTGWATQVVGERAQIRAYAPHVRIFDHFDADFEGAAGWTRLPEAAYRAIRAGLESGPVLCQVPMSGSVGQVRCTACGAEARCPTCGEPIGRLRNASSGEAIWECRAGHQWADAAERRLVCENCGAGRFSAHQIGSQRLADELRAAFGTEVGDVSVVESSSTAIVLNHVDSSPRLVVATPGAEPIAEGGYSVVLLLQATVSAYRSEMGALLEASRRFFNALALARPQAPCLVVGDVPETLGRALTMWDPAALAKSELDLRKELGFFPAAWLVEVSGEADSVQAIEAAVVGVSTDSAIGLPAGEPAGLPAEHPGEQTLGEDAGQNSGQPTGVANGLRPVGTPPDPRANRRFSERGEQLALFGDTPTTSTTAASVTPPTGPAASSRASFTAPFTTPRDPQALTAKTPTGLGSGLDPDPALATAPVPASSVIPSAEKLVDEIETSPEDASAPNPANFNQTNQMSAAPPKRIVLRCDLADAMQMMATIRRELAAMSRRHQSYPRIRVNPAQIATNHPAQPDQADLAQTD